QGGCFRDAAKWRSLAIARFPRDVPHSGRATVRLDEGGRLSRGPALRLRRKLKSSIDRWTMISALSCMRNNQSKEQNNEQAEHPQHRSDEHGWIGVAGGQRDR